MNAFNNNFFIEWNTHFSSVPRRKRINHIKRKPNCKFSPIWAHGMPLNNDIIITLQDALSIFGYIVLSFSVYDKKITITKFLHCQIVIFIWLLWPVYYSIVIITHLTTTLFWLILFIYRITTHICDLVQQEDFYGV